MALPFIRSAPNVLISGAGIAGPTLAYWLVRSGCRVTIVERAPGLRTGGYMVDFWGSGYDVAERMGLLPAIHDAGYHLAEVRLVDADGRRFGGFDAGVFREASHGRFVSIPRGELARLIYESVQDSVETLFDDSISRQVTHPDGVEVTFAGGARRDFDLVIGADGVHSNVRSLTFGPVPEAMRYLGFYAAAFTATDYPHRDEGVFVTHISRGRHMARYALRDGRTAFLLLVDHSFDPDLLRHDDARTRTILDWMLAGAGWESADIRSALVGATDLFVDAISQVHLPRWSLGRVALVGDAAWAPSLLAGEGSALAMSGAFTLATALARCDFDFAQGFADYQQAFMPFVTAKQNSARRIAFWFVPRTQWQLRLQHLVTRLMGSRRLTRYIAKRTLDDSYTLPAGA